MVTLRPRTSFFFFFNDTATTEIYTLSLHDALPISPAVSAAKPPKGVSLVMRWPMVLMMRQPPAMVDRKSTRLNSSHGYISYAVFCLKKKKTSNDYVTLSCQSPELARRHPHQ